MACGILCSMVCECALQFSYNQSLIVAHELIILFILCALNEAVDGTNVSVQVWAL